MPASPKARTAFVRPKRWVLPRLQPLTARRRRALLVLCLFALLIATNVVNHVLHRARERALQAALTNSEMLYEHEVNRTRSLIRHVTHTEAQLNRFSDVRNKAKFRLAADAIPLVLYVYRRSDYLRRVLADLRAVEGIAETRLIVSHDGLYEDVIRAVSEVDFCQVQQLMHPTDPTHPANKYELKKHWLWVQKQVWGGSLFRDSGRPPRFVLFLEEDHSVSVDFYLAAKAAAAHVAKAKHAFAGTGPGKSESGPLWGFSLSTDAANTWQNIRGNVTGPAVAAASQAEAESLALEFVLQHGHSNTAYAFGVATWAAIAAREPEFLAFPDGWDYSLYHLMQQGWLPETFLRPAVSRVRNIGEYGTNVDPRIYGLLRLGQTQRLELTAKQARAVAWRRLWVNATAVYGKRPSGEEAFVGDAAYWTDLAIPPYEAPPGDSVND